MNECVCPCCGEEVPIYGDCFCDRIERNKLTKQDKDWLKKNSDYLENHKRLLNIPEDLVLNLDKDEKI